MKENKKAILEILKKKSKKDGKFESLVLNLALQKIDSDSFEFDGDAVYTADKKRLVYCMSQAESFHIPEGVTTIGEMAFRGKKQLKNIIIANSVKEIEHDAFYDCDELDNVYVPAGVKEVKSYAFAECDKLKKITFAGVPAKLSRHTFDDCDQLHDIIVRRNQQDIPQSSALHRRRYRLPGTREACRQCNSCPCPTEKPEEAGQERGQKAGCSQRQESRCSQRQESRCS